MSVETFLGLGGAEFECPINLGRASDDSVDQDEYRQRPKKRRKPVDRQLDWAPRQPDGNIGLREPVFSAAARPRKIRVYVAHLRRWRPVATEERYQALLEVADVVEALGRFRCVLALAREAGRRINAIVSLRASDVVLDASRSSSPWPRSASRPRGPSDALRWRAEHDKMGYEAVAPLSRSHARRSAAVPRGEPEGRRPSAVPRAAPA